MAGNSEDKELVTYLADNPNLSDDERYELAINIALVFHNMHSSQKSPPLFINHKNIMIDNNNNKEGEVNNI